MLITSMLAPEKKSEAGPSSEIVAAGEYGGDATKYCGLAVDDVGEESGVVGLSPDGKGKPNGLSGRSPPSAMLSLLKNSVSGETSTTTLSESDGQNDAPDERVMVEVRLLMLER